MEQESINTDVLVDEYLQLRDAKEEIQKRLTKEKNEITEAMDAIEIEFLRRMEADGLDGLKTSKGTVFKLTKTFAKVADWTILINYIKENDAFDLLTKNVSKDAVKTRMDDNDGQIVPGVDMYAIQAVGIRRS